MAAQSTPTLFGESRFVCVHKLALITLPCRTHSAFKEIVGSDEVGPISGPHEEWIWSCSNCGEMLQSENRCDSCGARIESEGN